MRAGVFRSEESAYLALRHTVLDCDLTGRGRATNEALAAHVHLGDFVPGGLGSHSAEPGGGGGRGRGC